MSKEKSPPFVMIERNVLDSPAWRAMSHGARSLYLALRRRYNRDFHNNGKIFISVRNAAIEIGSHRDRVSRWYHELQHFGFIVMTKPGNLGLNGAGRATQWRLTEVGYMKNPPTRDFERWNGTPYVPETRDGRTTVSCPRNQGHTEPLTVPETRDITS